MRLAVLDANVLYPAHLRDVLLRLAAGGFYRPRWSTRIHEEWTRNLLANRPDLTAEQLARTQELMERAFPDAGVEGRDVGSAVGPRDELPPDAAEAGASSERPGGCFGRSSDPGPPFEPRDRVLGPDLADLFERAL